MEQRAEVEGSGNLVVQIEGDRNTVNLKGLAHLSLTRFLKLREARSDADRLSPYALWIPLVGRQRELADLRAWLDSDQAISVRVLTGRAGSGKTRLALELCEEMQKDWDAGFVRDLELRRFLGAQNLSTWGWQRPTLAVIDYAASHAEALSGWLGELSDYSGPATARLRLLLLERWADRGAGWWQTAFDPGGFSERGIERLLDPKEPVGIEPIASAGDRRKIVEQVLTQKAPSSGGVAGPPLSDEQLTELSWGGEPLFLMMAAMMAAEVGMPSALSLRRTDLAFELAERELRRVATFARGDRNRQALLKHLTAYITLCRGLDREQAEAAAAQEKDAIGRGSACDPAELTDLLVTSLPGSEGRIEPILPDIIGEAAILKAFKPLDSRSAALVLRAFAHAGEPVAATVIRTTQDFADGSCKEPLEWLKALAEASFYDIRTLSNLLGQIPKASIILDDCAIYLSRQLLALLKDVAKDGLGAYYTSLYVVTSNDLAERLSARGKHSDAVALAQESLLLRSLVRQSSMQPNTLNELIAGAHCTLSNCHLAAGKPREALTHAEEALSEIRSLDPFRSVKICSLRARVLTSMGSALSSLREYDRALSVRRDTLFAYVRLKSSGIKRYQEKFIISLANLANTYGNLRRDNKGLPLAHKATSLSRGLAADNPDEYRPLLSTALLSLVNSLIGTQEFARARERAKELIDVCGKLVAISPSEFDPRLAASLATFANIEERLGNLAEAQQANLKAIEILKPCFFQNPHAHKGWMADMVQQYRKRCRKLRQAPGATVAFVEIVLRQMAAEE